MLRNRKLLGTGCMIAHARTSDLVLDFLLLLVRHLLLEAMPFAPSSFLSLLNFGSSGESGFGIYGPTGNAPRRPSSPWAS